MKFMTNFIVQNLQATQVLTILNTVNYTKSFNNNNKNFTSVPINCINNTN